jgi:hypothetical protein
MAAADSQKLQDKLLEMAKLLAAGRGNRDDTASLLTEAAERLHALDASNKRLREEVRGPAQLEWSKFMGNAIQGHLAHEMIALEFSESQWEAVLDNCEDIAEGALARWKRRWVDGISPVKRPRKGRADAGDSPPRGAEKAGAPTEPPRTPDLDRFFEAPPRQEGGPRMVDAVAPPPKPAAAPASEEKPPATPPLPVAHAAPPAPKPEPPLPQPKERQPGDD